MIRNGVPPGPVCFRMLAELQVAAKLRAILPLSGILDFCLRIHGLQIADIVPTNCCASISRMTRLPLWELR